jgi:hypothetical protein
MTDINRSLIELLKDFLREGCGGHAMSNGKGDVIWYAKHPINISVLASNINILLNGQQPKPVTSMEGVRPGEESSPGLVAQNNDNVSPSTQQPVRWSYCQECGSEEYQRAYGGSPGERVCSCGQSWWPDVDYAATVQGNLRRFFLATKPKREIVEPSKSKKLEKSQKRLRIAIGGLRSIAYGDAATWLNCSSRDVAKQGLKDCGGEKHPNEVEDGTS